VQAKRQIFDIIWQKAADGLASILVSTELEEVLEVADRILVVYHGAIASEVDPARTDLTDLMACAWKGGLAMTLVSQTAQAGEQNALFRFPKAYPMEIILAALVILLVLVAPGFASTSNILNVLWTVAMLRVIAFGMTAVIVGGEIDLSVGAGAVLAGCIVAWFADRFTETLGDWGAVAVGFAVAVLLGFTLGYLAGRFRQWSNVPTFITTLALLAALRGVSNLITGGFPMTAFRPEPARPRGVWNSM
jgi:hypothetical protein